MNLTDLYHDQATKYRAALQAEIRHTIAIYGYPLPDDVRSKLIASLKEIEIPTMPKGNTSLLELNKVPKPNWHLIFRNVIEESKI